MRGFANQRCSVCLATGLITHFGKQNLSINVSGLNCRDSMGSTNCCRKTDDLYACTFATSLFFINTLWSCLCLRPKLLFCVKYALFYMKYACH